jgi:beta-galactosidase
VNGHFLGRSGSGYAPIRYDISDVANFGARNIIVVRVDATEHEGWFYTGAGIYRHSWLVKTHPVHVPQWGTYVTAEVGSASAALTIATAVMNESDTAATVTVISRVLDAAGKVVANAVPATVRVGAWQQQVVRQRAVVAQPALWSLETPVMHRLMTDVRVGGVPVDSVETPFGIRTIRVDAADGIFLNGKRVEIKGTCNHQDHAGVGSALPDRLQWYRVRRLKAMGSNAYRTSHNAPTPELLDACDALGMLVLDETRTMSSSVDALDDFEKMLRRDRNHPCVFAWSIGNEEPEQSNDRGARIATTMKRMARLIDPSRLVTEADNDSGRWGMGVSTVVDIQGFNYGNAQRMDDFHTHHPLQPTIGTEVASTVSTRGIYADDRVRGYLAAYDVTAPSWGARAEAWWPVYRARPWVAGGFVWTGFDYRGEPTPYAWPCISSHFGIMDTCGFAKDNFYYYQAWWGDAPVLHLFPHWNWPGKEGQEIEVWVHSNLDRVELLLNGTSLGAQTVLRDTHLAWKVPYAAGRLEARGFRGGTVVLTEARETTGEPAGIALVPDRKALVADGEDVAVIEVRVIDSAGRTVPVAGDPITFSVEGGRLLGVGNGDPSSHESDQGPTREAFNGLCCALVQSAATPGDIRVTATAPGLKPGVVTLPSTGQSTRQRA